MNDGSVDARLTSALISAIQEPLLTDNVALILVTGFVFVTKLRSQHGVDQLYSLSQRRFPRLWSTRHPRGSELSSCRLVSGGVQLQILGPLSLGARLVLISPLQFVLVISCCSRRPLHLSANSNQLFPSTN